MSVEHNFGLTALNLYVAIILPFDDQLILSYASGSLLKLTLSASDTVLAVFDNGLAVGNDKAF